MNIAIVGMKMTWNYESFWVVPHNWQNWIKNYPGVECRWQLRVEFDLKDQQWKITQREYSAIMHTRLDQQYLDERFDNWEDAVARAHDLVSTVATSHQGLTWPEAKAKIEAETDQRLF